MQTITNKNSLRKYTNTIIIILIIQKRSLK